MLRGGGARDAVPRYGVVEHGTQSHATGWWSTGHSPTLRGGGARDTVPRYGVEVYTAYGSSFLLSSLRRCVETDSGLRSRCGAYG
jgi:hypothetical protein